MSTAPHIPSDDVAILRAHDQRFANAQLSFDAACRECRRRPTRWAIERVKQAMLGLSDEYLAGLERMAGREPGSYQRLKPETIGCVERWEDGPEHGACLSDKTCNPAPIAPERGERLPLPKYDCQDDPHESVIAAHAKLTAEYRAENGCTNAPDSPLLTMAQSDFGRRLPPRHMPPINLEDDGA